jgi:asparagine synthase (glutamine-hydrolysing)
MSDALRHRGPDDQGTWVDPSGRVAFGFRRLAILDLTPAGHQPMVSPSGRYVMVFNGEVYNFQDLRDSLVREGARFRGSSDSEVILTAFERWGVEATLPRMIGMFAVALCDTESLELTLFRDRLGIKPLYVTRTRDGFAFASELAPLMRLPGFDGTLDYEAIGAYLRYLFVPAPRTPFSSVKKLLPGHILRVPLGAVGGPLPTPTPYWSLSEVRERGRSQADGSADPRSLAKEKTDELEHLLSDAVRLRLIADVPVGALLSGGIDSSVVVALMRQHASGPVRTYTIGFDEAEHDESRHARAVARYLETDHTELVLSARDALDVVPSLPAIFDEPLADPSQIPTFLVSRLAREHVTVALSGDGGDEVFAGYNRYAAGLGLIGRFSRVPAPARRLLARALGSVPPGTWDRAHQMLRPKSTVRLAGQKAAKLARLLGQPSPSGMYCSLLSAWEGAGHYLRSPSGGWDPVRDHLPRGSGSLTLAEMQLVDQRYYLPDDLLQKLDRASMAVSLEARVPILDHRVVEFSWTLPDWLKIHRGESKWLLRQVLDRHVPRHLVDRPKVGFSVPIEKWLAGALRGWAEDLLLARPTIVDSAAVQRAWRRFLGGRTDQALGLWAIAMLEAWSRHWGVSGLEKAASRCGS